MFADTALGRKSSWDSNNASHFFIKIEEERSVG